MPDTPDYGRTNYHTCGGALLFRSWVVTNAHCVTDMPQELANARNFSANTGEGGQPIPTKAKQFRVRVGSKDRTTGGELADVVGIVVHPGWHWGMTSPTDDIAMLKLDHPVNQQPIQLAGRTAQPGDRTMLYGWGVDQPDCSSDLPTQLQQLSTRVLPAAKCADASTRAAARSAPATRTARTAPARVTPAARPSRWSTACRSSSAPVAGEPSSTPVKARPSTPARRTSGSGCTARRAGFRPRS